MGYEALFHRYPSMISTGHSSGEKKNTILLALAKITTMMKIFPCTSFNWGYTQPRPAKNLAGPT